MAGQETSSPPSEVRAAACHMARPAKDASAHTSAQHLKSFRDVLDSESLSEGACSGAGSRHWRCSETHVKHPSTGDRVRALRHLIITVGIQDSCSSLREEVWPLLLGASVDEAAFQAATAVDPSSVPNARQIHRDVPATWNGDEAFEAAVDRDELTALCAAYDAWAASVREDPAAPAELRSVPVVRTGYPQGMNRLAAPLAMAMPLPKAWACLCRLVVGLVPSWFVGGVVGVNRGCALLDEVLRSVDPRLRAAMHTAQPMYARLFAFARIQTLYGIVGPSPHVLQLWDAILSFGPHLTVLLAAAEMVLVREAILDKDGTTQGSLPPHALTASPQTVITVALELVPLLADELYTRLLHWPTTLPATTGPAGGGSRTPSMAHSASSSKSSADQGGEGGEGRRLKPLPHHAQAHPSQATAPPAAATAPAQAATSTPRQHQPGAGQ